MTSAFTFKTLITNKLPVSQANLNGSVAIPKRWEPLIYMVQYFQVLESQVWDNSHCLDMQQQEGPHTLATQTDDQSRGVSLQ
jgi:hypothetical protein